MNDQSMSGTGSGAFYVPGGTLRLEAASYVVRAADRELHEALTQGEFCYVLTSRQMGKSSLMVRTAAQLRQEGATVAVIDLTAVGLNLTPAQWYAGLLSHVGEQLDLEDELDDFWEEQDALGPVQRWVAAVERVILPRTEGQVIFFVDEIDAVLSLSFSPDEFFAAIRACYNRRTETPELDRLTFCLIGVASPTDLNENPRTTPFNIGKRIELADFTEADGGALAQGLHDDPSTAQALLRRVLHWTNGHPYLTQRFCHAIVEDGAVSTTQSVDRICGDLFLSEAGRDQDTNLTFARDRVLRSAEHDGVGLADLLTLYEDVLRERDVPADDSNPLVSILKLAGTVRVEGSQLRVRNRIYESVFDRAWVRDSMPDAEIRRQRTASRRATLRTASVAAAMLALVGAFATYAVIKGRQAQEVSARAQIERGVQLLESADSKGLLYLLDAMGTAPKRSQMRLSAARLWAGWHAAYQGRLIGMMDQDQASAVAFAADGKSVLVGDYQTVGGTSARVYDVATLTEVGPRLAHPVGVSGVAVSPDMTLAATAGTDYTARLWHLSTGQPYGTPFEHQHIVAGIAFSPDGRLLGTASFDETARVWDIASSSPITPPLPHDAFVYDIAFSSDSRLIATASSDGKARIWDVETGVVIGEPVEHQLQVLGVAFSPDGKHLATTSDDATLRIWNVQDGSPVGEVARHDTGLGRVKYSPDGSLIVTGSSGSSARVWDAQTHTPVGLPLRHEDSVWAVDFAADGRTVVTASTDSTVRLWNVDGGGWVRRHVPHPSAVTAVAYRSDGDLIVTVGDDSTARFWLPDSGEAVGIPLIHDETLNHVEFSPDGGLLATASAQTVTLWDVVDPSSVPAPVSSIELLKTARTEGGIRDIEFSPTGTHIAAGTMAGLYLWRPEETDVGPPLNGADIAMGVAFSPDGSVLALAREGGVTLWDVATRALMEPAIIHGGYAQHTTFSPDGSLLAIARHHNEVSFWDTSTGEQVGAPFPHDNTVLGVTFSSDGSLLATQTIEGTVHLWDVATRMLLTAPMVARIVWDPNPVFAPSGQWFANVPPDRDGADIWSIPQPLEELTSMAAETQVTLGSRLNDRGFAESLRAEEWTTLRSQRMVQARRGNGP